MARQENIQKVIEGIVAAFQGCGDREPTSTEIIAVAGVSSATFYRVLESSPEAAATLAAARAAYAASFGAPEPTDPIDPIAAHPHAVVKELREVIASLLSVIEDQKARIERLERSQEQSARVVPIGRDPRRR